MLFVENFEDMNFQALVDLVDANIYWKDTVGLYLGCNRAVLEQFGFESTRAIIGKNDVEAFSFSNEEIKAIAKNDQVALKTGRFEGEESFTVKGVVRSYHTKKVAVYDRNERLAGTMGTSVDITDQKKLIELEANKVVLQEQFRNIQIIDSVNASIYWKDQNADKLLGCNQYMLNMLGLSDRIEVIGKNEYDFLSAEEALRIAEVDQSVLANGHYEGEENFTLPSGENRTYFTVKNCLYNSDRNIIGLAGTSIDITAQKNVEKLLLENERQQTVIEQTEKFKKEANQVAHDIRSPLSTILMTLRICQNIPEPQRVTLRDAATRINDIANNLIGRFRKEDGHSSPREEQREPILVSSALLEILTEKKYQYQNPTLTLNHHFSSAGNFAWIRIKPTALKRMVSNIINNAVDAFDGKPGQVTINLEVNGTQAVITIKDNGKGMTPELVKKIKEKIPGSEGKSGGHGIGMTQIHDTLDENEGQMEIKSIVGLGTQIILNFPTVTAQPWIADFIEIYDDDTVIVLDDDHSIHSAWDFRFEPLLKAYPKLNVLHHDKGQDTIDYFCQLSPEQRKSNLLLSDYELLRQGMNGLDVITRVETLRSILVTSYYGDRAIQNGALKIGTRILPKQLAAEVPIRINKRAAIKTPDTPSITAPKAIDAIFVDDDQNLLSTYEYFVGDKYVINTYHDPKEFLDKIDLYPKHTKIFLDQNYSNYDKKGEHIAVQMREMGYTRLYLLTGDESIKNQASDGLTVLIKSDLDALSAALEN